MSYQRGEIVLVPFPFTDFKHRKARPAVVVSPYRFNRHSQDVILVAISSKVPAVPNEFEVMIKRSDVGFATTGLRASSVIKASKLVTLKQSLIYVTLGKLPPYILLELNQRMARAVGLPSP